MTFNSWKNDTWGPNHISNGALGLKKKSVGGRKWKCTKKKWSEKSEKKNKTLHVAKPNPHHAFVARTLSTDTRHVGCFFLILVASIKCSIFSLNVIVLFLFWCQCNLSSPPFGPQQAPTAHQHKHPTGKKNPPCPKIVLCPSCIFPQNFGAFENFHDFSSVAFSYGATVAPVQ